MSFPYASLLGLPLDEAQLLLAQRGLSLPVAITSEPRGREGGTLRVVRAGDAGLVCAAFLDGMPVNTSEACAGTR